jgi:P4 family phage/plasmid primase-like protien
VRPISSASSSPTEPRDPTPTAPDGPRTFRRGDHVELARTLLEDLRRDGPHAVIADRGDLYCYRPESGLYERIEEDAAARHLMDYAGSDVGTGEKTKVLKLKCSDVTGSYQLAQKSSSKHGFFNAAPRGIAFRNGFVTIQHGAPVLRAHSAEHRALDTLPFDYDPNAKAPRWEKYLAEVWAGTKKEPISPEDRAARIAVVEEWVGATLLGEITKYEKCLVLLGQSGNNGKSVMLDVISALFPQESIRSIPPQEWNNPFHLAELAGCRLNCVNELPDNDVAAGDRFKAVVSGNGTSAARKRRDPFTLRSRAGHLSACNLLPYTRDLTGGFWKRWIVLGFNREFSATEIDVELRSKIIAEDLPGIAVRVLAAAARLEARGHFVLPDSAERLRDEWRHQADQVAQFVELEFPVLVLRGNGRVGATSAFVAFQEWAKKNGHGGMSFARFGARLKTLPGIECGRSSSGVYYELAPTPGGLSSSAVDASTDECRVSGSVGSVSSVPTLESSGKMLASVGCVGSVGSASDVTESSPPAGGAALGITIHTETLHDPATLHSPANSQAERVQGCPDEPYTTPPSDPARPTTQPVSAPDPYEFGPPPWTGPSQPYIPQSRPENRPKVPPGVGAKKVPRSDSPDVPTFPKRRPPWEQGTPNPSQPLVREIPEDEP